MKYLLLGLIVLLAGLVLLREHLQSKEPKETYLQKLNKIEDSIGVFDNVNDTILFTNPTSVVVGSWTDVSGTGTVEVIDELFLYNEIKKLRKELLAAIEKNKCKHEIIILDPPDEGFHNMPYLPDRTDPRFDTNAYKILLQSNN